MKDLVLLGLNSNKPGADRRVLSKRMRILLLLAVFANTVESVLDLS